MKNQKSVIRMAALAVTAGALLALPATAGAHIETAVESVTAHTDRADSALDRSVALFDRGRDRKATRAFDRSRAQMGKAKAEAAKLHRSAESDSARADAALARETVASQQDENVEQLVGVLDEVSGRVENRVAKAALADTRGRDKAISILSALMDEVPVEAQSSLADGIAALSQGRVSEVRAESRALVSDEVSKRTERRLVKTVQSTVEGQHVASQELADLIASVDTPAEAQEGLQQAYDAIQGEQQKSADVLSRFSDRMPAAIRSFVSEIVQQAQTNAQELGENVPAPPAGQLEDTGAPGGSPSGAPEGTPTL